MLTLFYLIYYPITTDKIFIFTIAMANWKKIIRKIFNVKYSIIVYMFNYVDKNYG